MNWTPEIIKMLITLSISNFILLLMASVWGWLSIKKGEIQEISGKFIALGAILAGPDVVQSLLSIKDMIWG